MDPPFFGSGQARQWIERSGDPDFKYDSGLFMLLSGLGAALIAVLGWRTAVNGLATARGRHASWLGPAMAALPLHWFWFLYRTMGNRMLGRHDGAVAQRNTAIQFGIVCLGYLFLWLISRRPNGQPPAGIALHSAPASSPVARE